VAGDAVPSAEDGDQFMGLFSPGDLDVAVDGAARAARATVATFVASPIETFFNGRLARTALEIAVEFFIPPAAKEVFAEQLEAQLLCLSDAYAQGRRQGRFAAPLLRSIPAGTFHQWRMARHCDETVQHADRWTRQRRTLNSLLDQARVGFRELSA